MKRMSYKLSLLIASLALLPAACSLSPEASPPSTSINKPTIQVQQGLTLREAAQKSSKRAMYIGTAVNLDAFHQDANYKALLGQQFNMIVPENALKMTTTHPSIDTYDYRQADELISYAKQQRMQIRGAHLLWSNQVPSWIYQGNYSRDQLLKVMKDYITTVVSHYKGQIQDWDVVNEPFDLSTTQENSIWEKVIGPDYMDFAFQYAHEADPQAHLYLNEYSVEMPGEKSDRYYNLAQSLLNRGVPLSGVGIESHMDLATHYNQDQMVANIQRFASLGLQIQLTEADVMLQNSQAAQPERLKKQASIYTELVDTCLMVDTCNAIVFWGFTDRYTWIPAFTRKPDQPLLYDEHYHPKLAYYAVRDALYKE